MRVAIAEDSGFFRNALAESIQAVGNEVVVAEGDAPSFLAAIEGVDIDVALMDICLPPTLTDDGLVAAESLAVSRPNIGIVILSAHLSFEHVMRMLAARKTSVGCISKDQLSSTTMLIQALERVHAGGTFIDPDFIEAQFQMDSLRVALTPKELEVMRAMAEGYSNQGIASRLFVNVKTVESSVTSIFRKLNIEGSDKNARVSAVLKFLGTSPSRAVS